MSDFRSGWQTQKLGEVLKLNVGGAWGEGEASSGVRVLRTNNITADPALKLADAPFRSIDSGTLQKLQLRPGDIVMTKSNSIERVGRCAIFPEGEEDLFIPSNFCQLLRFDHNAVNPWFGLFWLRAPETQSLIKAAASGTSASLKNVGGKKLADLHFSFPPLPEQRRIVARIQECLARVGDLKKLQSDIAEEARALLLSIAIAFIDSSWATIRLGDACTDIRNGWSGKQAANGIGVRMLRLSCVHGLEVDTDESKPVNVSQAALREFAIKKGDVLVVRGNGSLLIRLTCKRGILPDFINFVLQTPTVRQQIEAFAKTAAGIWKINQKNLSHVEVPCPTQNEQAEFVHKVIDARGLLRELHELAAVDADMLKDSVLRHAFAGEL